MDEREKKAYDASRAQILVVHSVLYALLDSHPDREQLKKAFRRYMERGGKIAEAENFHPDAKKLASRLYNSFLSKVETKH